MKTTCLVIANMTGKKCKNKCAVDSETCHVHKARAVKKVDKALAVKVDNRPFGEEKLLAWLLEGELAGFISAVEVIRVIRRFKA